jgi:cytochrome b subunit of formate dehydrogenase
MTTLQNVWTWLVAIALLTALLPGSSAGILGRSQQWPIERTRRVARWLAVALSITWWVVAVYGLNMAFPYDWVGATIGTPVRVLAFTAWCLSPGYFAPLIAEKISALKKRSC